MDKKATRVYWVSVIRISIVSSIVVPLGALYISALVSFQNGQFGDLIKILLWLPILLLVVDYAILRLNLSPLIKALDKIYSGVELTDQERLKAERSALIFPYLNVAYAIWWFSIGGFLLAMMMVKGSGVSIEAGVYIAASAVTCGAVAGIAVFFVVRKPMGEALKVILEHYGAVADKPSFFVPISVTLTGLFLLLISLIMMFLGFFSFVLVKTMLNEKMITTQVNELAVINRLVDGSNDRPSELVRLLNSMNEANKTFCLADNNFNLQNCAGIGQHTELLDSLKAAPEGSSVQDNDTGWNWAWKGNDEVRIISGWAPQEMSALKLRLQSNYLRVGLVVLIMGLGLGILVAIDISRPLRNLSRMALEIAEGKQEIEIAPGREDETGILARAFHRMTNVLLSQLRGELDKGRSMMKSINNAIQSLAPMSKELVAIAEQQASGSIEQASASEEAATSSEEIASVARQIAENAVQVSKVSEGALKVTQDGQQRLDSTKAKFDEINKTMDKIAAAMIKLGDQSQEIGGIVQIIDEISEQTNLLALNAAIEAVGAGEHGMRFGVVANEIRRLAQSTAESTKQIQDIVSRMQASVSSSTMLAEEGDKAVSSGRGVIDEMATNFGTIYDSNIEATRQLKEIDMMTSQQATASEQMAKTINEIRDSANQSSMAAGELKSSIEELESIVILLESHIEEEKPEET